MFSALILALMISVVYSRPLESYVTCSLTKAADPSVSLMNSIVMGVVPNRIDNLFSYDMESKLVALNSSVFASGAPRFIVHSDNSAKMTLFTGVEITSSNCNDGESILYNLPDDAEVRIDPVVDVATTIIVFGSNGFGQTVLYQIMTVTSLSNVTNTSTSQPTVQPTFLPTDSISTLTPTLSPIPNELCVLVPVFTSAVFKAVDTLKDCEEFEKCPGIVELFYLFKMYATDVFGECTPLDFIYAENKDGNLTLAEVFVEECVKGDFLLNGMNCLKLIKELTVYEFLKVFGLSKCVFETTICFTNMYDLFKTL